MLKQSKSIFITISLLLLFNSSFAAKLKVSRNEVKKIGYNIYKNECGLNPDNLTHWNTGEDFPSLGIGHFIWYPSGSSQQHSSTFPKLIQFLIRENIAMPSWLRKNYLYCPWKTREEFYSDFNGYKMKSLRDLLKRTMYLQTIFIVYRFNDALPKLLAAAKRRGTESKVRKQLVRVIKSPLGLYALIDYSNFKGAGTNPGAQWGLLQVLENMNGYKTGKIALYDFAKSAAGVLRKRVLNSKNITQEKKWYIGWVKRLETYYK